LSRSTLLKKGQSIVEDVVAIAAEQILNELLGHAAFEGVEVELVV